MRGRPAWLGRLPVLGPFSRGLDQTSDMARRYAAEWTAANQATLAEVGDGRRLWAVLGDSTAQGVGASAFDQGYVGQVARHLAATTGERWGVVNLSRSGARAADVVQVQLPALAALGHLPDLVTCAIGANDILRTPLAAAGASLRTVMARLPDGAVVATLPQGLRPRRTASLNHLIRAEAAARGLRVADVWARTGPPWAGRFAADQFHPNDVGYRDWAAAFVAALEGDG